MEMDIDTPPFLRKGGTVNYKNESIGIDNDNWDMPTFLRKKGN